MASMKDLFPLHKPKTIQRNFIKENIRNAKGCAQCIAERRAVENTSPTRSDTGKTSIPSKRYVQETTKISPSIRYNVKIVKRERSSSRNKRSNSADNKSRLKLSTRGCQTDAKCSEDITALTTCENCGHSLLNANSVSQSSSTRDNCNDSVEREVLEDSANNQILSTTKDSHQISHENEKQKNEIVLRKLQNPTSYKKGEVPRYLKDRNAKLERDRQERETKEKLEELLGFKDPKCPPGHMLMSPDELAINLDEMQTKFNNLISELNRMPVSNDSYKIRRRTIQIEKELKELEEKIELYKTKRVFVKIPEFN